MISLSLAPFFYRNILSSPNSPFRRIAVRKDGSLFHAYVYLKDQLWNKAPNELVLYGNADGNGTDVHENIAIHKAISEAIDRWAFHASSQNPTSFKSYGLEEDPTSTGFAAFPGLTVTQARLKSSHEATERWALCSWWEGLLPIRKIDPNKWEIVQPFSDRRVVLVTAASGDNNLFRAYGFACESSLSKAVQHAQVELDRNVRTLKRAQSENLKTVSSVLEQRLIYFSTPDGHQKFKTRINQSEQLDHRMPTNKPDKIADTEIKGPWSKYAYVWRTLFKMPSQTYLSSRSDYFQF